MLWEIIFEMLGAMSTSLGEIFAALFSVLKPLFGVKKDATPEERRTASQRQITAFAIVFVACALLALPGVRNFVFHGGGQKLLEHEEAIHGPPVAELPRNNFPMAQYTSPQLFIKKKMLLEDDDGLQRNIYYYFYAPAPEAGQPGQKLPLVVVLHDSEGMDYGAIYLRMAAVQKYFPSYLLIPQAAAGKIWDAPLAWSGDEHLNMRPEDIAATPGEESRSIRDLIPLMATAVTHNAIDRNRMYIVGCDMGADGVYGALARYPTLFAGGVAIGGKWSFSDQKKLAKTPLLILQGGQDQVVPSSFTTTLSQIVTAAGGTAAYHEFPALGHNCDASAFYSLAVWKWLFSQVRTPPQAAAAAAAPGTATASAPATPAPVAAAVPAK